VIESPVTNQIAAVSVGIVNNIPVLDLDYVEDSSAQTDMNVVMNESGLFIEIQGTAEHDAFSTSELNGMLELAKVGIQELLELQTKS
jgi:ribonuclease PH